MTQEQIVLHHLQRHGDLTALQAMSDYGIMQLPARIHHLRQIGHRIESHLVTGENRRGERVRYSRYSLVGA